MTESSRMPEYADEQVLLSVEPPPGPVRPSGCHPPVSARAHCSTCPPRGAAWLADMLRAAAVTAAADLPGVDLR